MAFAITSGNFGDTTTWDTGVVPTGSEDAYSNSFTIQVNGTQSCGRVRNDATTYLLPGMPIPVMTSSTTPTGRAFSSTFNVGNDAWRAFDQNTATLWSTLSPSNPTGWLAYTFSTAIIIKRYLFRLTGVATVNCPASWTFEGSNDEFSTAGVVLHTVTSSNPGGGNTYTSPTGLVNTGNLAFTSYRINISANGGGPNVVQISEFEMTEQTGTVNGGVAGGTFNLTNGSNLTTTASTGVIVGSLTNPLTFALASPNSAAFNGNIIDVATVTGYGAINMNGTGALTLTGNYAIGAGGAANRRIITVNSAGILNIIGNLTNSGVISANINNVIQSVAAATINVTGNVTGGGNSVITFNNATISASSGGNVTITGNVNAGTGIAIGIASGTLTVIGDIIGSSTAPAIQNSTTAATIDIAGAITAGTGANAIVGLALVRCSGLLFNTNNFQAVYAPRITIEPTTTSITFQKIGGGTQIMYVGSSTAFNLPAINNVRSGTVYGQSNEFTGTMIVQTPENVLLGTLVDNTVGTLIMTPDNLIQELGTNTRPIAVRLQNSATVEITGDQMASYNI